MIMTFNLQHGRLNIDESLFFTRSWSTTRGQIYKLLKLSVVKEVAKMEVLLSTCGVKMEFRST